MLFTSLGVCLEQLYLVLLLQKKPNQSLTILAGVSKPYIKEWNLDIAKPTDAQLDALEDEANAKEALNTILNNRRKKYNWNEETTSWVELA